MRTEPLDCQRGIELATDYLEDALEPATRRLFELHTAGCPGCGRYLDQLRRTVRVLGSIPVETVGEAARRRLVAAFRIYPGTK